MPAVAPRISGGVRARTIAQLASMELRTTSDVAAYAASVRAIADALALEIDVTAHELYKALATAPRSSLGDRFAARRAAWQVTRELRGAAAEAHGVGVRAVRFWTRFSRTYSELIHPEKTRKGFQFEE